MKINANKYKINEQVKFVRQSKNITQKELVGKLGKSLSWLKKIEQEKNNLYYEDFIKICELCDVDITLTEKDQTE